MGAPMSSSESNPQKKSDGRAKNGGARPGAGRKPAPPVATQEQVRTVAAMAQVHAEESIRTLHALLKSKSATARARAADSLLDRGFGKPPVNVDVKADVSVTSGLASRVARAKARARGERGE